MAGFQEALGRLWLVLKGYGLMKPRHVPVLIAMMDDFVAEADRCSTGLDPASEALVSDVRDEAERLRRGGGWPRSRPPQDQFSARVTPVLKRCVER